MENIFNVPVEMFRLEKLVLNKQKNCKVWFTITDLRGDNNVVIPGWMEPNYQCVYSMQKKLDELKPYLLKLRHKSEKDASKVNIKGVIWKGEGEKEAFRILGTEISDSEKSMEFNSSVEHVNAGVYGFEMAIRDIIIELEAFAHAYVFEGVKAEITLGLGSDSDDEENEVYNAESEIEEAETVE